MSVSKTSHYRGYEITIAVHSAHPSNSGFVGLITVALNGERIESETTSNYSHFSFAEHAAESLGKSIVDHLLIGAGG